MFTSIGIGRDPLFVSLCHSDASIVFSPHRPGSTPDTNGMKRNKGYRSTSSKFSKADS